jgi:hypothetical protein
MKNDALNKNLYFYRSTIAFFYAAFAHLSYLKS